MQLVPGDGVTSKQRLERGIAEEIVDGWLSPWLLHGAIQAVDGI
jgi:hypothetical protein